jgi:hypothetical protein
MIGEAAGLGHIAYQREFLLCKPWSRNGWRGPDFARRQVIYTRLDSQFRTRTRFFAAAALTNQLLSTLFQAMPGLISATGHDFLNRLGSALEVINLNWARTMPQNSPGGPSLDEFLVRTEQAVAQEYCDEFRARAMESWQSVRREMNALLNGERRIAICAAAFKHGRDFRRVLAMTRRELSADLDFALEAHRVRIGCALIDKLILMDSRGIRPQLSHGVKKAFPA